MIVYKAAVKSTDDPPRYMCESHAFLNTLLYGYGTELVIAENRDCDDCLAKSKMGLTWSLEDDSV